MQTSITQVHPATKILLFAAFAVSCQWLKPAALLWTCAALGSAAVILRPALFARMLKRVRFIFLGLVLIYGYATPGQPVSAWLGVLAPTHSGLIAGGTQALRLACMLAALSFLLGRASREEVLSGLYVILHPLRVLRIPAERIAVRIWLTLNYAEEATRKSWRELTSDFGDAPREFQPAAGEILLPDLRFTWRDPIAALFVLGLMGYAIL